MSGEPGMRRRRWLLGGYYLLSIGGLCLVQQSAGRVVDVAGGLLCIAAGLCLRSI